MVVIVVVIVVIVVFVVKGVVGVVEKALGDSGGGEIEAGDVGESKEGFAKRCDVGASCGAEAI